MGMRLRRSPTRLVSRGLTFIIVWIMFCSICWNGILGTRTRKPFFNTRRFGLSFCTSQAGPLSSQDLVGVAEHLQNCKHVIVMVGAGISVNAGIPDFRTPGTGLYDNLQKYNLPYAEAIFEIDYFRKNPRPFYTLCKALWPGQHRPTTAHYFITLLHQKGMLQRCYSQNIDSLETTAGLPKELVVAAHGNFDSATCIASGQKVSTEEVREAVMDGEDACNALSQKYGGLVKPDIVFFGENLPGRFFQLVPPDFDQCDLLLVLGTSLQVHPFAGLINEVRPDVPRLLINRERAGEGRGFFSRGFRFDQPNSRDVFFKGDCDSGVRELVELLGWGNEFESLLDAETSHK